MVLRAVTSSTTIAAVGVGDPSATRTVYVTTIALVVLGVALAVLAFWLLRQTRPEPELLAPLEEMETRAWRNMDPEEQQRTLDASRPPGARPVARIDDRESDHEFDPALDSDPASAADVDEMGELAAPDEDTPVGVDLLDDDEKILVDVEIETDGGVDADADVDAGGGGAEALDEGPIEGDPLAEDSASAVKR